MQILLDEISAKARKILFFGPSGCGKTHFVNAINGEMHKVDPTWTCVKIDSLRMLQGDAHYNVEEVFKAIESDRSIDKTNHN